MVVFRYPPDPAVNYIKRLVGLPGDHVAMRNDQLIINGQPVPLQADGRYDDGCYHNMRLSTELLGSHTHQMLSCLTPGEIVAPPSRELQPAARAQLRVRRAERARASATTATRDELRWCRRAST